MTDDTAAARRAVVEAAGKEVYFPAGTYVIDALNADARTHLRLSPGARLLAKPNTTTSAMINFTGVELTVQGGTIDGNRLQQSARPVVIGGSVQQGKSVRISDVLFTGTVKAALYLSNFGGFTAVDHCTFIDQAEHTGELNVGQTSILSIISGQSGSKGSLRFSYNRCVGTITPVLPGGNPGGIFVSPAPTLTPGIGNLTTVEAIGNYFWGYGQNCAGNTISAIHLYRSTMAARISGNYFEQSSFSAISAKSVTDFLCSGNVFSGGSISTQNVSSEGVISYVPGYNAGSVLQPRGIITSNVIESPGGQSTSRLQNGISIHGTNASPAQDVVVAKNVVHGAGIGIQIEYANGMLVEGNIISNSQGVALQVHYARDLHLGGNLLNCSSTAPAGSQSGITLTQVSGLVTVSGNMVRTLNGHGLLAVASVHTSRMSVIGNRFDHSSVGYFATTVRGTAFLKISGNEFNATAGVALDVRADSVGNKVLMLAYDLTNTAAGLVTFVWPDIVQASGQLRSSRSPLGIVTPAEVGTTYQQSDGVDDSVMWVSRGTTNDSWIKVLSASSSNQAASNQLVAVAYDPVMAQALVPLAPAGVLALTKVLMVGGGRVTRVLFHVAKAGMGMVASQSWIGIYSAGGVLIGQTDDLATILGVVGSKAVALKVPTPSQSPGTPVFIGLLWNGTTSPQLQGIAGGGVPNIGITAVAANRFAYAGSGLTAVPTTRPTCVAVTTAPWFGVA